MTMNIPCKPALPLRPRPICIIGAGGIVNDAHLPAYKLAGFTVAGICDLDRSRAENLASKFDVAKVYESAAQMIAAAPADVVYDVAVTAATLLEVLDLLPPGAPVLMQKPMGEDFAMAQRILACCRRKGLLAAVNFQLRFAPFVIAARWLVEQGHLGQLYDAEVRVTVDTPWHLFPYLRNHPRLEVLYHSIHYIDLLRSFLGSPASVMARTLRHPAKDLSSTRSAIILNYGDALRAVISVNHDHVFGPRHQESFIKLEGTSGAVKARMGLLMDYPAGVPDTFEFALLGPSTGPDWQRLPLQGTWFPHAFIGTMASLMRYAEGTDSTLSISVEDAIQTMAIVEAVYRSSARGGEPLPVLPTGA
ncbi:MAG: Gfo/Idh/MocA family oxidoreductase [Terracidiphilus sp.]